MVGNTMSISQQAELGQVDSVVVFNNGRFILHASCCLGFFKFLFQSLIFIVIRIRIVSEMKGI